MWVLAWQNMMRSLGVFAFLQTYKGLETQYCSAVQGDTTLKSTHTHTRAQLFHSSCAASLSHLDVEQSLHTCSSKRSGRALLNALLFLPLFYSYSHPSFLSIHLWLTESCIWAIKCNIIFSKLFKCIIELLVRVKHRHCTCSTQRNRPNSALTVLPVDPTLSVFRTLWVCFTLCSRLNVSETFILLLHSKLCTCWTFCRVHRFPGLSSVPSVLNSFISIMRG